MTFLEIRQFLILFVNSTQHLKMKLFFFHVQSQMNVFIKSSHRSPSTYQGQQQDILDFFKDFQQ